MKFILGKKIEMSQVFDQDGDVHPVTIVECGPCIITQIKSKETDGYSAVQIGFEKKKRLSSGLRGHLKRLGNFRWIREFRITESTKNTENKKTLFNLKRGDNINVNTFEIGDKVKLSGVSKGKGSQGVVKRHGFHGMPASHGTKHDLRHGGSIGATDPARVFKGRRMAGHMGSEQVTVKNLGIIKIDKEKNLLYLRGAVPGARNSLVEISCHGKLKVKKDTDKSRIVADNADKKSVISGQESENVETQNFASLNKDETSHKISHEIKEEIEKKKDEIKEQTMEQKDGKSLKKEVIQQDKQQEEIIIKGKSEKEIKSKALKLAMKAIVKMWGNMLGKFNRNGKSRMRI